METQSKLSGRAYARALQWLESYRGVAERKAAALTRNDLAALEGCLDEESNLVSQRVELIEISRIASENSEFSALRAGKALTELAAEIQSINRKNTVLIEAGFEFSRTLLRVMRPSATYGMRDADNGAHLVSQEPILSLEC
jgi:flagellar biosynthesis/type III secretory pathway chaperone